MYAVKTSSIVYGQVRSSFYGKVLKPTHNINKYFVPFTEKSEAETWIFERIDTENWKGSKFEIIEL